MSELIHRELTGDIIGAYYEVYNHTHRIYPEYIYERAMMEELRLRGRSWADCMKCTPFWEPDSFTVFTPMPVTTS